jgi:uncharacterized OB-fold protein
MRTDDQASLIEAHFLAAALRVQRSTAPANATPGRCGNCGERCLPRAIYCDANCREDHERRVTVRARQGAHGK